MKFYRQTLRQKENGYDSNFCVGRSKLFSLFNSLREQNETNLFPLLLFKYPLLGLLLIFACIPLISAYIAPSSFVWPALLAMMGLRSVLENVIFTSVMILV